MTASGLAALEEEFRHLKNVERPAISKAIGVAREHGDLKENAEYHAAKERQSFIEGRLKELEGVISCSQVIDPSTLSGDRVQFGATVLLADEKTDEENPRQNTATYVNVRRQGNHAESPDNDNKIQKHKRNKTRLQNK